VPQLASDLLVQRQGHLLLVDQALALEDLAVQARTDGLLLGEVGQRARELLLGQEAQLVQHPAEVRHRLAGAYFRGLPADEDHRGHALVGRHQLERARQLLVEHVEQQVHQRRLRERAARGGGGSVGGGVDHGRGRRKASVD